MAYFEFEIPARSWSTTEKEILLAKMAQIGFEGFVEGEELIQAYIEESNYSDKEMNQLVDELASLQIMVQYRFHKREEQNWNEEWEKKFDPVAIDDRVLIRAPFHGSENDLPCTLVIEPKMSFGTGHHHTTRLMILEMNMHQLTGKTVLDMGCGTGVLGIYASKQGASSVLGVDYDRWAFENAMENVERNGVKNMEIRLGDVTVLGNDMFDVILANITRNTLVRDLPVYRDHLVEQGLLLISGILAEDVQYVLNEAYRCGLDHKNTREISGWLSLTFINQ